MMALIAGIAGLLIFGVIWLWATSGSVTISWNANEPSEGPGITGSITTVYTGNNIIDLTIPVAHSVTNQETDCYIKGTGVKFLVITSDKDLTLYLNDASGGSPTDGPIAIAAGVPWEWHATSGIPFPFAGTGGTKAINKIFSTNAGGTSPFDAVLRLRGLQAS